MTLVIFVTAFEDVIFPCMNQLLHNAFSIMLNLSSIRVKFPC